MSRLPQVDAWKEEMTTLLNQRQIAELLGICSTTVKYSILSKRLPAPTVYKGKKRYYRLDQVPDLIKAFKSPNPKYINTKDLAKLLQIRRESLYYAINEGKIIPPKKVKGYYRVWDRDLIPELKRQYQDFKTTKKVITFKNVCKRCHAAECDENYKSCERCRTQNREHQRRRRLNGICTSCNSPARPNKSTCKKCAKKAVLCADKWQKNRKKQGKCHDCGQVIKSQTLCEKCLERRRQRYHKAKIENTRNTK